MKLFRLVLLTVLAGIAAAQSPSRAETVALTLLFACDTYKVDNAAERGGFSRLNAVVKAERAKWGHIVYAHGGDLISPSLMSGFDKGEHTIALTNMAPPDIFTPGNHEFDFGEDVFRKRMSEARFPIFAANLRTRDGIPLPGFRDTEIKNFGGLKVGFIGLTADNSPRTSKPGPGLSFASIYDTGVTLARELREAGADMIVAVVHADRATDMRLYSDGAFDIILSGDDHDLAVFYNGRTAFAEAMQEANYVIAIDLKVEMKEQDSKRRIDWFPDFRIIDTAAIASDPDTQARVDAYNAELSKKLDVSVGITTEPLDSRSGTVRTREAAIGNLFADAMRWAVNADAAIINGGSFRGNTEYAAGKKLNRRDFLAEVPFGDRTVTVEASGADILQTLEDATSLLPSPSGFFPQVSGITFTVDTTMPKGQRVSNVKINGRPLDGNATYTVVTIGYLVTSGGAYEVLRQGKPLLNARDDTLTDDVMAYVSAKATVSPKVEGRIDIRM